MVSEKSIHFDIYTITSILEDGRSGEGMSDHRICFLCERVLFFFFQAEDGIRDIGVTGVQTCALPIFQEEGGGRRLGDKGERAVLVDRDLDRDDLAHLVARGVVELPHELPDVHLRLPERRADRRRGVRLPAGDLQLQFARYAAPASSTHNSPLVCLKLRYLVEGELHRRLAPEDGDEDLQPRLVHVDVGDRTREVRERTAYDLDRLPDGVVHRGLDLLARLDPAWVQEPLDLGAAQGERLLPGTYDLGDAWRLAHELPGRVVHVHVDEDVAGELALDGRHLLAVLDLDDVLRRDPDLSEVPVQTHRVDPSLQGRAHLVLVPRVCVYYVPLLQNVMLLVPTNAYRKIKRARRRSEERRVGKECRSRWSPYH